MPIRKISPSVYFLRSIFLLLLVVISLAFVSNPVFAGSETFVRSIGGSNLNGVLDQPTQIAFDASGNIYVTDTANARVQKFDSSGVYVTQWGTYGTGDGQFNHPFALDLDSAGNVYVTDKYNNRVQKFTSDGTYLAQWSAIGYPEGIAVDSANNCIYVSGTNNHRIYKYDMSGAPLLNWGGNGGADGLFSYPTAIAVDTAGNVYVADRYNVRIQKFDSSGNFLLKLTDVWYSNGVDIDAAGNIYATDNRFGVIKKFTSVGVLDAVYSAPGSGDGQLSSPAGITIDSAGNFYVVDQGNGRIQKFTDSGAYVSKFGKAELSHPSGMTTDSAGNIYIADSYNHRIAKYNAAGVFQSYIGSAGNGEGQLRYPEAVAFDSSGNIFIVDSGNNRIQKFDSNGAFILQWGAYGTAVGEFSYPTGIAIDAFDNVYIADNSNFRVQKFTAEGAPLAQFGSYGLADGQFSGEILDIVIDSVGNIYTTNGSNSTSNIFVQKFNSSGEFITKWGQFGVGSLSFKGIGGLAVDTSNNIYVIDPDVSRVKKFTSEGVFIDQWGSYGSGDGQFVAISRVTVDDSGDVYVSESGNGRVQKFTYNSDASLPVIYTGNYILDVAASSVAIDCNVVSDGGDPITERGIVYSTTVTSPTLTDTQQIEVGTTGQYTATITGLTQSSFYYVRAYATNSIGTVYGDALTFYVANSPTVITGTATDVVSDSATVSGEVTSDGGSPLTYQGIAYSEYNLLPDCDNDNCEETLGTIGTFSATITNLASSTLYYARAYASNEGYTTYGDVISFTTPAYTAPTAITDSPATQLSPTTATVSGSVNSDGSSLLQEVGIVYSTVNADPNINSDDYYSTNTPETGAFVVILPNLLPETLYYARAYVTNSTSTYYGDVITFTTPLTSVPVVTTTSPATNISYTTAVMSAEIVADGGLPLIDHGFVISDIETEPTRDNADVYGNIGGAVGNVQENATELTPNTLYYFRIFATNSDGVSYGNVVTFTTLDYSAPVVITQATTGILDRSATLVGTLVINGGYPLTEKGFVYSSVNTTPDYDNDTKVIVAGTDLGEYTSLLDQILTAETTYYVRAYAINDTLGIAYGDVVTFTTSAPLITIIQVDLASYYDSDGISFDANPADGSFSYDSEAFSADTFPGTITVGGVDFATGPTTDGANNTVRSFGQNITLPTAHAASLQFLAAESWEDIAGMTFIVHYTDASTAPNDINISLWTDAVPAYGETVAYSQAYVNTPGGPNNAKQPKLFLYSIPLDNTKVVSSIEIPNYDGDIRIAAMTLVDATIVTVTAPTVVTGSAADITYTTAMLSGNVTSDGTAEIIERGIVYSDVATVPTIDDLKQSANGTVGEFTALVENLTADKMYYFRAYATNSQGTSYGDVATYTTLAITTPVVTTLPTIDELSYRAATISGELLSTGGDAVISRGFVVSSTINPPTRDDATVITVELGQSGVFASVMDTLTPGTLYYFRAYAENALGTTYGDVVTFTTNALTAPTVVTNTPAVNVSYVTASVTGTVTSDGGDTITERGVVYSEVNDTPTTDDTKHIVAGTTGDFSADLVGLTSNTQYYARTYAVNPQGTSYGDAVIFTTLAITIPTVTTTDPAVSLTATTATIGGTVVSANGAAITERGIVYSTTTNPPTTDDSKSVIAGTTGSYSAVITGLPMSTAYFARAYAVNAQGTAYGDVITFTTLSAVKPTVSTTSPATSIATTSATIAGVVSSDGGAAITERGIVYSSSNNTPTTETRLIVSGTTGAISQSLTGLTANTTYYARVYAINSEGVTYGNVVSFRTLVAAPVYPPTLISVYFTFGKLRYGRYATPAQMRSGDMIYLKNYNPKQVQLLAISLYDYKIKGNQCYSRTWRSSTSMMMKTCGLLPTKRQYAFIFTFRDIATGVVIKKYFVVNTISPSTITL